jgi:Permuted papain-like amidase enzyme, YaeF/YiiX, C92 family
MKKLPIIIASSLISVLIILLTGWISFSNVTSTAFEFSFFFHLIPFGIGFSGGAKILIFLYYLLLWLGLSLLIIPFVRAFYSSKNKKKFLTFLIAPLLILTIAVIYIDYSKNKKQEESIAITKVMDKTNFHHLQTGDLLFQKVIKNNTLTSDTTYNIGIAFIDGENYALLETKEQVQYVSIGQWIENGINNDYVAKRLKYADTILTSISIEKLQTEVGKNILKKNDTLTNWSDIEMYNAELIWKIYKRSLNIELGSLDTLAIESNKRIQISANSIFNSKELISVVRK